MRTLWDLVRLLVIVHCIARHDDLKPETARFDEWLLNTKQAWPAKQRLLESCKKEGKDLVCVAEDTAVTQLRRQALRESDAGVAFAGSAGVLNLLCAFIVEERQLEPLLSIIVDLTTLFT